MAIFWALMDKIYIIGIGADGAASLSPRALELINRAEMLIGGKRLLALFPQVEAQKVAIREDLGEIEKVIKDNFGCKRIRVLASGDPNFFGIARYLVGQVGKDVIEIIPNISSIQLAFAKIKESWEDAAFLSLHARPLERLLDLIQQHSKLCLLTDGRNSPDAIGRFLLDRGVREYKAFVCEELGGKGEKVFEGSLEELIQQRFSPLNILILLRDESRGKKEFVFPRHLGLRDKEFHRIKKEKGLITKGEIRAVSLAKMEIREDSIVWDIGAGTGAVSIEASFLARRGKVYAVEIDKERLETIQQNIKRFNALNVHPAKACAPEGLESLPDPDAIFIGGSGGKIGEIIDISCERIKKGGRIVVNLATLENLSLSMRKLEEKGLEAEITFLNIARGKKLKDLHRLESLNPVFIVTGRKE